MDYIILPKLFPSYHLEAQTNLISVCKTKCCDCNLIFLKFT